MTMDFVRDRPIYLQITDKLCGELIEGTLQPGDKLPSVREYAVTTGVNVNTIQRVYKELEMMALTETKRGQGTFVTENHAAIVTLRENMKLRLIEQFFTDITALGFTKDEMIEAIQKGVTK